MRTFDCVWGQPPNPQLVQESAAYKELTKFLLKMSGFEKAG